MKRIAKRLATLPRQFPVLYAFSSKIPRPRDPTAAQSIQTKLSKQQVEILIDPKGFMSEQQKIREQKQPQEGLKNQYGMEPQFGFKPQGPEPTRYGDWQVKGKCVDF